MWTCVLSLVRLQVRKQRMPERGESFQLAVGVRDELAEKDIEGRRMQLAGPGTSSALPHRVRRNGRVRAEAALTMRACLSLGRLVGGR